MELNKEGKIKCGWGMDRLRGTEENTEELE
jgi:hypothetical protein